MVTNNVQLILNLTRLLNNRHKRQEGVKHMATDYKKYILSTGTHYISNSGRN